MDSKSDISLKIKETDLFYHSEFLFLNIISFLKNFFWGTVDVQYKFQMYNIVIHNF